MAKLENYALKMHITHGLGSPSLPGFVGQEYIDTLTGDIYVFNESRTWKKLGNGGTGHPQIFWHKISGIDFRIPGPHHLYTVPQDTKIAIYYVKGVLTTIDNPVTPPEVTIGTPPNYNDICAEVDMQPTTFFLWMDTLGVHTLDVIRDVGGITGRPRIYSQNNSIYMFITTPAEANKFIGDVYLEGNFII